MEHSTCERNFEMHVIIKGHVQGVGFRSMTSLSCLDKLHGSVRNLPNGTVEICAQGSRLQLENLIKNLRKKHYLVKLKKQLLSISDTGNT